MVQSTPAFMAEGRERQVQLTTTTFAIVNGSVLDFFVLPCDGRRKHLLRAWVWQDIDPAATTGTTLILQEDDTSTETALTTSLDIKGLAAQVITQLEVINPIIPADAFVQCAVTNAGGAPDTVTVTLILEWVYMDR